ncbi:type II toxin-antitoxin system prevent-host-death family antitoxin [Calidifontibacter sp. DB0510]|uniref:Antitoxin n=1 Tax=Metallococcus carri TaxID=1656884 RepID=A0A967AYI6_9MICO|nr:type II toxin-antitoxin system prevent-host-death family antitoxin [Metallococcus carri]NHN54774.1 type II toxin-antitoxin system prevent-host-death family antitoxin [Metallococcus carri]NOP37119.1 type II toxin-antitoxin system prevent-host-death family antitoxin [Calidifontibacter sp. DB2511S]
MDLGIRELRDGLSRHIAAVRQGEEIVVTDHGRPVARIVPIGEPSPLERLIAEGVVTRARSHPEPLPPVVRTSGRVSDLAVEQRR